MPVVVVTGHQGLVGSACAQALSADGYEVHGIDCDIRSTLFSDAPDQVSEVLQEKNIKSHCFDLRDSNRLFELFERLSNKGITAVIHCAAQPSHDWATQYPFEDFSLNALATLNVCEAVRMFACGSLLVHFSTNKVYGDHPNHLPLIEGEMRLELDSSHRFYQGINESMSIDNCLHSLFGVSKTCADLYVQEYSRHFNMRCIILRGGCLTGPNHRGAKLHGFMNYLLRCAVDETEYTVIGYRGKQVRDNLHSTDIGKLISKAVKAETDETINISYPIVANMGGGRGNDISILELVSILREDFGLNLKYITVDQPRTGDHKWYISDNSLLSKTYGWRPEINIRSIISDTLAHI